MLGDNSTVQFSNAPSPGLMLCEGQIVNPFSEESLFGVCRTHLEATGLVVIGIVRSEVSRNSENSLGTFWDHGFRST